MRPWQDWRWIAAVGVLLFSIGFSAFVVATVTTREAVQDQAPVIDRLEGIAGANAQAIDSIEKNQQGIDSLVAFVEDLRADDDDGDQGDTVATFIRLLCASSDPVRLEECRLLGVAP